MDLATIEIDPDTAREHLAEYTDALKRERNVEDEAIAAAYRAAARGLPVISLSGAVAGGGFFDNGLPRIAIARADANICTVRQSSVGQRGVTFTDEHATGRPVRALVGESHVSVLLPDMPRWDRVWSGSTVVPPVPPRYRPRRHKARLGAYHILWEVERWDPTPPRDPALLRHIRGDLWAVLAVWDLTEVERLVLGQRGSW